MGLLDGRGSDKAFHARRKQLRIKDAHALLEDDVHRDAGG